MKKTWKHRLGTTALTLTLLAGVLPAPSAHAAKAADLPIEQAAAQADAETQVLKQRCASYNLPKVNSQWTAEELKELETLLGWTARFPYPYPYPSYDCMDATTYGNLLAFAGEYVEEKEVTYLSESNWLQIVSPLDVLQTWLKQNLGVDLGLTNQSHEVYSFELYPEWKMTVENGRVTLISQEFGIGIPNAHVQLRDIYDLGNQTYLVYSGVEWFHDTYTGDEKEIFPNTAILRKVDGKLSLLRFDGIDEVIPGTEADLRKYSGAAPAALARASQSAIYVDGKRISFDAYALRDAAGNDTNYLKLRDVALVLNGSAAQCNVGWENGTITLTTGAPYASANGTEMKKPFSGDQPYQISTSRLLVDGRAVQMNAILLTVADGSGHTYVKLRDLGAALGFAVAWDNATGTVQIHTGQG